MQHPLKFPTPPQAWFTAQLNFQIPPRHSFPTQNGRPWRHSEEIFVPTADTP